MRALKWYDEASPAAAWSSGWGRSSNRRHPMMRGRGEAVGRRRRERCQAVPRDDAHERGHVGERRPGPIGPALRVPVVAGPLALADASRRAGARRCRSRRQGWRGEAPRSSCTMSCSALPQSSHAGAASPGVSHGGPQNVRAPVDGIARLDHGLPGSSSLVGRPSARAPPRPFWRRGVGRRGAGPLGPRRREHAGHAARRLCRVTSACRT